MKKIILEYGGKAYSVPCTYQGMKLPADDAADLFRQGKIKAVSERSTYQPASPAPKAKLFKRG